MSFMSCLLCSYSTSPGMMNLRGIKIETKISDRVTLGFGYTMSPSRYRAKDITLLIDCSDGKPNFDNNSMNVVEFCKTEKQRVFTLEHMFDVTDAIADERDSTGDVLIHSHTETAAAKIASIAFLVRYDGLSLVRACRTIIYDLGLANLSDEHHQILVQFEETVRNEPLKMTGSIKDLFMCSSRVASPTNCRRKKISLLIETSPNDILEDRREKYQAHMKIIHVNDPDGSFFDHIADITDLIAEEKSSGGRILVCCRDGVTQAPVVCVAYLIRYEEMALPVAWATVQPAGGDVLSQSQIQLQRFEKDTKKYPAEFFEVTNFLYFGSVYSTKPSTLRDMGFNAVIDVSDQQIAIRQNKYDSSIKVMHLVVRDKIDNKDLHMISDKIYKIKKKGGKVLVHCYAGLNRAPMVCIAYLIKYENMTVKRAHDRMKHAQPHIRLNQSFVSQLVTFEEGINEQVMLQATKALKGQRLTASNWSSNVVVGNGLARWVEYDESDTGAPTEL